MASKAAAEHYRRLNGKFLREAEELLADRDYVQASEKLWGAAAEIVKAVAAKRGIMLRAHRSITDYAARLDDEHPELNLATEFSVANNLHVNFYEDWLAPRMVEKNAEVVKNLIRKIERLL